MRARAGLHGILGHFLPQPNPGEHVCRRFPRSPSEGLCPAPGARGEAHGCPRRKELWVGGQGVTQGARCAGTGALGRARARLAPRSRHRRRQASAWGGKYGFVPGRPPARRVRREVLGPAAPGYPPRPARAQPSPARHPCHGSAARGETEAKRGVWECSVRGRAQRGSRGRGPRPGRAGDEGPGPSGAGRPRCLGHGRPDICKQFAAAFRRCFPLPLGSQTPHRSSRWLPRGLAQARPCAAEPRPVRAGAGNAAGPGQGLAGPLTAGPRGEQARAGEPTAAVNPWAAPGWK